MAYDAHMVIFWDISILKNQSGGLVSKLFRKVTAGNTLLHADSFYPVSLKKLIPFSKFLRIKQNCTTTEDFQRKSDELTTRLLDLKLNTKSALKKACNRVKSTQRQDLIFKSKDKNKEDNVARIIIRYSNEHNQIRKITCKVLVYFDRGSHLEVL